MKIIHGFCYQSIIRQALNRKKSIIFILANHLSFQAQSFYQSQAVQQTSRQNKQNGVQQSQNSIFVKTKVFKGLKTFSNIINPEQIHIILIHLQIQQDIMHIGNFQTVYKGLIAHQANKIHPNAPLNESFSELLDTLTQMFRNRQFKEVQSYMGDLNLTINFRVLPFKDCVCPVYFSLCLKQFIVYTDQYVLSIQRNIINNWNIDRVLPPKTLFYDGKQLVIKGQNSIIKMGKLVNISGNEIQSKNLTLRFDQVNSLRQPQKLSNFPQLLSIQGNDIYKMLSFYMCQISIEDQNGNYIFSHGPINIQFQIQRGSQELVSKCNSFKFNNKLKFWQKSGNLSLNQNKTKALMTFPSQYDQILQLKKQTLKEFQNKPQIPIKNRPLMPEKKLIEYYEFMLYSPIIPYIDYSYSQNYTILDTLQLRKVIGLFKRQKNLIYVIDYQYIIKALDSQIVLNDQQKMRIQLYMKSADLYRLKDMQQLNIFTFTWLYCKNIKFKFCEHFNNIWFKFLNYNMSIYCPFQVWKKCKQGIYLLLKDHPLMSLSNQQNQRIKLFIQQKERNQNFLNDKTKINYTQLLQQLKQLDAKQIENPLSSFKNQSFQQQFFKVHNDKSQAENTQIVIQLKQEFNYQKQIQFKVHTISKIIQKQLNIDSLEQIKDKQKSLIKLRSLINSNVNHTLQKSYNYPFTEPMQSKILQIIKANQSKLSSQFQQYMSQVNGIFQQPITRLKQLIKIQHSNCLYRFLKSYDFIQKYNKFTQKVYIQDFKKIQQNFIELNNHLFIDFQLGVKNIKYQYQQSKKLAYQINCRMKLLIDSFDEKLKKLGKKMFYNGDRSIQKILENYKKNIQPKENKSNPIQLFQKVERIKLQKQRGQVNKIKVCNKKNEDLKLKFLNLDSEQLKIQLCKHKNDFINFKQNLKNQLIKYKFSRFQIRKIQKIKSYQDNSDVLLLKFQQQIEKTFNQAICKMDNLQLEIGNQITHLPKESLFGELNSLIVRSQKQVTKNNQIQKTNSQNLKIHNQSIKNFSLTNDQMNKINQTKISIKQKIVKTNLDIDQKNKQICDQSSVYQLKIVPKLKKCYISLRNQLQIISQKYKSIYQQMCKIVSYVLALEACQIINSSTSFDVIQHNLQNLCKNLNRIFANNIVIENIINKEKRFIVDAKEHLEKIIKEWFKFYQVTIQQQTKSAYFTYTNYFKQCKKSWGKLLIINLQTNVLKKYDEMKKKNKKLEEQKKK